MYSWYWSSLQDWASTLISTTLIHYPSKLTDTHTHTHTHTHTDTHAPQRSPAGTEALPERALLLNWLLGYGSMMLQPADSLLNDVVYFPQNYILLWHGDMSRWCNLGHYEKQPTGLDSDMIVKSSNISHSQDSLLCPCLIYLNSHVHSHPVQGHTGTNRPGSTGKCVSVHMFKSTMFLQIMSQLTVVSFGNILLYKQSALQRWWNFPTSS